MANRLELSDDRMELKIHGPQGRLAELRSRRAEGFTDVDLDNARVYSFSPGLERGQINEAWRFESKQSKRVVYVHKGTGPPTWWFPRGRISFRKGEVMAGWLRLMIAVKIGEKDSD